MKTAAKKALTLVAPVAAKALEQEITNGEFRARMPAKKKVD
jgi:hypothetical protein